MSKPEITTQIRIQSERDYWFTVEDIYLDLGSDGLTIAYWEIRNGKEERVSHICIDGSLALAVADTIYKLFETRTPNQLENNNDT